MESRELLDLWASKNWEEGAPQLYGDRHSCAQDLSWSHPMYLFIWQFTCIFYSKPVNISAVLSWILWAIITNDQNWGGVYGNLSCIKNERSVSSLGTHYSWLASSGRQSCGIEPLICGSVLTQVISVRIKLNCRTSIWCPQRIRESLAL